VVAGESLTAQAEADIADQGVALVLDGRISRWAEAIAHLSS
jgi:hypothetical protein